MSVLGLNQEGYKDTNAAKAIANVIKAEKKYLPLVYICSKYSGDTVTTQKLQRYSSLLWTGCDTYSPLCCSIVYARE